jgi:hypothetical protein
VLDFNASEGDTLHLDPGVTYVVSASGADTVVTLTATGDSILLVGVSPSTLPDGSILLG